MSIMSGLHFGLRKGLPVFYQTESAECGIICLAMISAFHGHHIDLVGTRSRLLNSVKGISLKNLVTFATEMRMAGRAVRLELEDLPQLQTPCILHWDLEHYVVLKSANAREIVIHDPSFGVRKLKLEDASKHFSGVALELSPMPNFEQKHEAKRVGLGALIGNISGLKRSIFQILLLSVALEILAVVAPFFQQWVLDGVIVHNDTDLLKILTLGFLILMLIQMALSTLRTWMVIYFSTQINIQWATSVLTRLLRLPMDYFSKRHLGDVISRFGSINAIRETLTNAALGAVLDGLMATVAFVMMWIYSPKLAFITLIALLSYIAVRVFSYSSFSEANEELIIYKAKQDGNLLETVRGVQSIKLFNSEDDRRNQWLNLLVNTTNRELASQRLTTLYQSVNGVLFGIENVLVVYVGAVLIMSNELSIGMSFAYASYKTQFSSRISALVDLLFRVRMLRIQRERLADIVLSAPEAEGGIGMPNTGPPDVEIRNLSFRYSSTDPWIFKNLNLHIAAGESVALVGPSGCGKTTLLKLMLGLLTPTEGEILVMGRSINAIGLPAWRERLGAVMQDDQLFAGNIAENISFFTPKIDQELVEKCAKLAAVDSDILAMPMTWKTLIGDMGSALSGGQKQRILLARALYKQPDILFLDEATSHLDVPCEKLVNQAVRELQLTKIIIAHRIETIQMADRVIELSVV